jgi:glycosyltransferase involved in cell wall biosynthesis
MPNYNSEKYVQETIQSVLEQTYRNWELIFVDDCSTDKSLDIVRSFDDDRIKIFQNEKNSGAAVSRNKAIKVAAGRWIAFLDSDDLWIPEKLERQIAYMFENDISFSYTDYDVIDEANAHVTTFRPHMDICTYRDILKHNYIGCLTAIYDCDKVGKVYMPENAIKREDLACWLCILKTGEKGFCLHECLARYKVHSNSVSSNKLKMMKYQWLTYRKVEKMNVFSSIYYLCCWAVMGFFKYR